MIAIKRIKTTEVFQRTFHVFSYGDLRLAACKVLNSFTEIPHSDLDSVLAKETYNQSALKHFEVAVRKHLLFVMLQKDFPVHAHVTGGNW